MSKRVLLWVMTVTLLSGAALPGWAKAAPTPAPNVPAKAGNITALLPVAHVVRGAGKTAVITDAKKGDELVWNDLVKTDKGGRARITLSDQSILSLGSQAELRIVKHDARTQQTSLQMAYGRVRAQVASITRDGGSFELRTPTAVAGVIGTDFGVDSSASGGDTFVCIAGATQISNSDPSVPGAVQCSAGQTTTVAPGKSPTAPTPASLQQLQQLIEDTEPAIISSISPAAALPGTNFDSNVAGSKMGKVTSVSVAGGSGVSVSIKGASETSVQIHVVVDATASAGPRTITLVKEAGASSATVFTVLGTPIGDPKKAYLETLEQLKSTGVGGLGAFLTGAQQAADQVAQQITQANQNLPKPLDLSPFADSLNQQYGVLSNDLKGGTGSIDKAAQDAATTFAGLYDTAYQALLQRDPTGTPDTTFTNALTAAFTQANAILQAALQNTQTGLSGAVQTYGDQLNTIQQTWSQNINSAFVDQQAGPLPKINALERIVELGSSATFDAGSSSASNAGASITSYQWTLCSQNYQPTGYGQLLPEGQAGCNGIQGFVSNSPEFQISTCTLAPGSYFARLAVTDSNNKISQIDVKLTVLSPNYPTPGGTVRALADAYTSLQLSQFLRLFDAAQFNGYTPLSENVRQTMQSLASMAINLRLSQENVTCNDATVRADWQQNYTFIGDASTVYNQTEQLSVRLQRVPGNGWYIVDFQGDNGKVQGVVPGPQTADTASPDLAVAGTTIDGRPLSSTAPIQVAAGPRTVVVNITNNGTATLANGVLLPVTITLQDTNGTNVTTIDTFNGSVPSPINVGSTAPVQATLNFPTTATNLTMLVQVNPSCNPPEKTCGAPNNVSYPLLLGLPDFTATFIPTTTVNGIVGRSFNLQAVNVTPSPYPVALNVAYNGLPAGLAAASPANNTTNINGALVAGTPSATGSSTLAATATSAGITKNVTGSATIAIGNEITVTPTSAPSFIAGGVAQNLTFNVAGGVYPVTVALTLPTGFTTTSGTVNGNIATKTIPSAQPVTFAMSATGSAAVGAQNFLVVVTDPGVPATNTPTGNVTTSLPFTVTGLADLQAGLLNATAGQQGATYTETVTVSNVGNAAAAAGWDVKVVLNGQTVGTAIGPAIPAGQQANVPVTVTIPVFQAPPLDQIFNGTSQVNTNQAIPEVGTGNNTSNYSQRIVDFVLTSTPQTSMTGVVGRPYAANQVATLNPTPYPTNVTVSFPGLPAGLAGNGVGGGLLLPNIVGTPTGPASANITPSAVADGITHSSGVPVSLTIVPEISITQQAAPTLTSGGAPGDLVVGVTGGIYPVTVALTLPTGITTTNGTIVGNISTFTLPGPGNRTWTLSADFTAASGSGLLANILATDPGNSLTTTAGGNVPFQANYTVAGNANFSITGVTVTGHTAPYTLANAFQVDESTQFQVTVKNTGNTSPTGNVTVVLDCGNASFCDTPATITVPAPAAGASVAVPVNVDFIGFAVASYNGSASLTTDVSGAGVGTPVSIPFDVVDFTIGNASLSPFQNLPIGGIATLDVSVAVQRPSGSSFGISITAAPTDPALVFTQPTQITAGAQIPFPLTVGASAISGQGAVRFNATNHGVTKFVDVPYVAFTASLSSTTLFVNDSANPLTVPVAVGAQAPTNYPTVGLKLISNFDHANGSANLTVQQPGCGSFSATLFPPTAIPNDVIDLPIFAAAGNTCPAGTQVVIIADIPQTFPQVTIPVYTLFVAPSGLPQLSVVSATPARDISTQPWLSGEPLDWTVVIKNTGSAPSTGNEKVTMSVGAGELGVGTVAGPIPAGQSTSVNVHTVAPDYPQSQNVGTSLNVSVKVPSDAQGDLSPGNGGTNIIANFANWGIGITSGNGVSDGTPLDLSPTASSNSADIAISNQAAFNPNLSVSLVPGSYSSNQLNAPGFSPNSLSSATSSTVTVSYPSASALTNGLYFVQVIAQMKDGATVTAQRQTTIHVRLTNQSNSSPAGITLASDRTNIGPAGQCTSPACQTIQINGPLPEAFTLTASVSSCSAGNGCPGTADISFSDSFMTVTTPPVSTVQVTSPGNTLPVRVKAADNPDGTINVGNARVDVSVNAVTASFFGAARTPTPDPVGTKFEMNFAIGDLNITAPICVGVPPQDTAAVQPGTPLAWVVSNGFNVASVQWEWQDPNHVPAGASPLGFSPASGSSTFTGNGYTALPTFNLTNPTTGVDGLQTYYFAFTVSNGVATATKYFPIDVDLSRSQTFCPIVGANRGGANVRLIRGSWGKAGLNAASAGALRSVRAAALSTKLPDLRISASDISFTPSIPKPGDTVAVRFRISNVGDGDAVGVPVALQVHGKTVVSDTFDIPAGKTVLGGLEWANARPAAGTVDSATARADAVAARRLVRTARLGVDQAATDPTTRGGGNADMRAQIVIDPLKTIAQKTTLAKSAALTHFGMRNSAADAATLASIGEQRVLLELPEGACGGLKFVAGAGSCTSADITFTVEDLAKATYKLESLSGIADLGAGATSYANASFGSQALGQNGHTYAVQLNGGKVGLVTVTAVRNPEQLSEAAKRLFRQRHPVSVVKSLGGNTEAPDTGDTAGTGSQPMVYFDIVYQGQ